MIYLATPYTHVDKAVMEARFNEAAKIAGSLMQKGEIIFCPITHTHPIAVNCELPREWQFWERFDREFVGFADKVIVAKMNGWEQSRGVNAEIAIAKQQGKEVIYLDV